MQTKCLKPIIAALLGATLLAAAQPSSDSQPAPQRNRPSGGVPRSAIGGSGRFAPGLERLFSVLTEEQRSSLREAMQVQREKMRDLEEKLRDARKELFEAGLKDKFDEDAIRQKAMAAAKLDVELTVSRAKAFSQMRPPLSAEQLEKLRNLPSPATAETQDERPRRRPEVQRDEHGLPPKDRVPAEPKPK